MSVARWSSSTHGVKLTQGLVVTPRSKVRCVSCGKLTKGGKSYCFDHIEQAPRVAWITSLLDAQADEIAAVGKDDSTLHIKEDSLTVQEIVNVLHHKGPITSSRIAHELNLSSDVIKTYVRYMRQMAIVSLRSTKKGIDHFVKLEVHPEGNLRMPVH